MEKTNDFLCDYSRQILTDMGSFVGHIDEAVFFILLAFWWMANKFPAYIKVSTSSVEMVSAENFKCICIIMLR